MRNWNLVRVVPLVLLAALVGTVAISGEDTAKSTVEKAESSAKTSRMAQPEFNDAGALLRPDGYQRWTLVGTSIGLDYSKPKEGEAESQGIFHNVYMQPEAFDEYVATGIFPEQTIFVVTNNPPTKKEGENDINRKGQFAGEPTGLEVSVKDSKRFEEGWGFFMFYGTKGERTTSKPFKREACYDCHAEHGEDDAVFVQFYTVLKNARAKKLAGK